MIMLYLTITIIYLMPEYFTYFNQIEPIKIVSFNFNIEFFKAYGLCSFLFLNQYTILPVINNLEKITNKRISKIILRTISASLTLYIVFMYAGYFSLPNDVNEYDPIFINRKPIQGYSDVALLTGKILFSFHLIIALLIKAHFLLLYFH